MPENIAGTFYKSIAVRRRGPAADFFAYISHVENHVPLKTEVALMKTIINAIKRPEEALGGRQ